MKNYFACIFSLCFAAAAHADGTLLEAVCFDNTTDLRVYTSYPGQVTYARYTDYSNGSSVTSQAIEITKREIVNSTYLYKGDRLRLEITKRQTSNGPLFTSIFVLDGRGTSALKCILNRDI